MEEYKIIRDVNFKDGKLTIMIKDNVTKGIFEFYDSRVDEIIYLIAKATCDEKDMFNEQAGIDLVKLKLLKQYYACNKNVINAHVRTLKHKLKQFEKEGQYYNKKYNNIKQQLVDKYELTVY